jgi:hypothetical protein
MSGSSCMPCGKPSQIPKVPGKRGCNGLQEWTSRRTVAACWCGRPRECCVCWRPKAASWSSASRDTAGQSMEPRSRPRAAAPSTLLSARRYDCGRVWRYGIVKLRSHRHAHPHQDPQRAPVGHTCVGSRQRVKCGGHIDRSLELSSRNGMRTRGTLPTTRGSHMRG